MLKHAFRNLLVCFDKQLNVNDIFRWQSLSCEERLPKGFESILADLITLSFSKSPCQYPAGFSTLVHLNDSMFGYIGRFQLGGQFTQVLFF